MATRKYVILHKWEDGYTASRHVGNCKWAEVSDPIPFARATDLVLEGICDGDGNAFRSLRHAYKEGTAVRTGSVVKFHYDAQTYAVVPAGKVKSFIRDEEVA